MKKKMAALESNLNSIATRATTKINVISYNGYLLTYLPKV